MSVRNWWIAADIDGKKTELNGGPRSKDGGFSLRIYQRDQGSIITVAKIEGMINWDGDLILKYEIGEKHGAYITKR